jgi:hypothetical protein
LQGIFTRNSGKRKRKAYSYRSSISAITLKITGQSMNSKTLWDLETAMKVLEHDSVDSKLWAEAVEWLMIYGPPEIRRLLLDASLSATTRSFPELKPCSFTDDGQPIYDVQALARSLGITEQEVQKILAEKEFDLHDAYGEIPDGSSTIH